jgi:hypothetical protein
MNIETTITKKGGNDKVSGCSAINANRKKFSLKEAPDTVVKLTNKKIFLPRKSNFTHPFSRCSFFPLF